MAGRAGAAPGAGTRAHEADGAALQDAAVGAAAEPQGCLLHGAGCRRQRQAHPAARAKMLGIDTILGTVCIVEKSIYSGGLVNVGRRPAFFML